MKPDIHHFQTLIWLVDQLNIMVEGLELEVTNFKFQPGDLTEVEFFSCWQVLKLLSSEM
jgi:hypothetical protein